MNSSRTASSDNRLVWGIGIVLAAYLTTAALGWPQKGTAMIAASAEHEATVEAVSPEHEAQTSLPPYWMILPFAILLGVIAVFPLTPKVEHWWDNNLHRFYIAAGLAVITILYYVLIHKGPMEAHWPVKYPIQAASGALNLPLAKAVLANALLSEYVPFITLLLTLYTIAGGIRIEGDLPAHPWTNTMFLLVTGLLASLIGTTGAAMLLVRPLLDTNSERKHVKHTVVFFIFVACNCGGCLLPLGDPPLFLGYLLGVPFTWTLRLWPEWLFVNAVLIAGYYLWDRFWYYPQEEPRDVARDEIQVRRLTFSGVWPNAALLVGVILTVGLLDPAKAVPGTNWHPWLYLREAVQLALVALSLLLGNPKVRRANQFNYGAILEVAALFFGIFICMQAPLQILNLRGPSLGLHSPLHFFVATGALSSVLDNAPTYVVFFETAKSLGGATGNLPMRESLLVAVSLGAVFGGAMTYIGNGPNFMVKSIAEKSGVRMPSFFGYMVYSCGILLPVLMLVAFIFLRT